MRHEDILDREKTLLLVVDIQERLLKEVVEPERVVRNTSALIRAATTLDIPVIVTEHNPAAFGPTAAPIRELLDENIPVFSKMVFSCFGVEEIRNAAAETGRNHILVAGLETHICVCQTALDAVAHDYRTHAAFDALSARSADNHRIGLKKMKMSGVVPSSTEMAIFEWLERAGTDAFRSLLPLIKTLTAKS